MKHYPNGIGATWKAAGYDKTVSDYIAANPGKTESEIATGTALTVDEVMWAISELYNQGEVAMVPENWGDFSNHPHHGRSK